ncbi:uracil-DNA glycosylase [Pseudogemmobacter bohemicus]|uniref:uracil-DNA glycosylase n=1 Tax=Pseudogemmobacter bohemicus TaxID=2250708 RepID=UPI000DD2B6DB|nr:uracil-DNA glycosylase [Pseudogemmobacter bohemicus]
MPLTPAGMAVADSLISGLARGPDQESWLELDFFRVADANHETAWHRLYGALLAETAAGRPWHPEADLIFRALELTPPDQVRVVFLGQDPYPSPDLATGPAFSYPPATPASASIAKVLAAVTRNMNLPRRNRLTCPCLEQWANQGVLLLNTILTITTNGLPGSHGLLGWDTLLNDVLRKMRERAVIVMLWGNYANDCFDDAFSDLPPDAAAWPEASLFRTRHPTAGQGIRPSFNNSMQFRDANNRIATLHPVENPIEINWHTDL